MLVVSQARYNLPLMPSLLAGGLAGWVMFVADRGTPGGCAVSSSRIEAESLPSGAARG